MIETARIAGILILLVAGIFFTFVSATGVIRLPDIYARAHTASQADTLGAGLALGAVALGLGWQQASAYTVLLLFFIFITNPTAAHAIARSASEVGIEPWTAEETGTAGFGEGVDGETGSGTAPAGDDTPVESRSSFGTREGKTDVADDRASGTDDDGGEPS